MQLFGLVNTLLSTDPESFKRHLSIQRFSAIPLSPNSGLLGWVPNCDTLHQLIREYRESRKILLNIEHRLMLQMAPDYDNLTLLQKVEVFEYALENTTGQDLYKVLWLNSKNSEVWLDRRTNYTRSLAVMSMVGYILGLGDRHPSNLMLHKYSGRVVHIDFGDCFEVSGIEGNFRITCENVMRVLRENKESLMAVLEAFVYDPLINWRLLNNPSPKQQDGELANRPEELNARAYSVINRVQAKLTGRDFKTTSGPLDVPHQVQRLILQATSMENLCQMSTDASIRRRVQGASSSSFDAPNACDAAAADATAVNATPVDCSSPGLPADALTSFEENFEEKPRTMRILMATEYLPPYVSGIANRCKNLIKGYRENGHEVTVAGPCGTEADIIVPSVPNVFYPHQRFVFAVVEMPYDLVHIVGPLCLSFLLLLPLFKLRGVKIYVSYHVYLEYYKNLYLGDNKILGMFAEGFYIIFYFIPLVWFADMVGIPSKTADWVVFKYSKQIHYMKSGLNTEVFVPLPENYHAEDDTKDARPLPPLPSLMVKDEAEMEALVSEASCADVKSDPVLVYVGRLAVEKNIEFLIAAMSHPTLTNASLVIVGDGPSRSALEAMAVDTVGRADVYSYAAVEGDEETVRPFGLGGDGTVDGRRYRILFVGMVRDEREVARGYYARADAFVSASGSETFGFTVAEAMACGTPAVVVRSGAFATVYATVDGWMFAPGAAADYVATLRRVLRDGAAARRVAR
ncbi:phosphatidylinositol kinase- protein kinase tor1, partial [Cladochytrium tenue]